MNETIQHRGRTWTIKKRDEGRLLIEWHGTKHPSKSGGWYCDYAIRWVDDPAARASIQQTERQEDN